MGSATVQVAPVRVSPGPESDQSMSVLSNTGKSKPLKIHVLIVNKDVPKWACFSPIAMDNDRKLSQFTENQNTRVKE